MIKKIALGIAAAMSLQVSADVAQVADEIEPKVIEWRHHFHQHPARRILHPQLRPLRL